MRQGYFISSWLFNLDMDGVIERNKVGLAREGANLMKTGREWKVLCLLYVDNLALCGESEESFRRVLELFD